MSKWSSLPKRTFSGLLLLGIVIAALYFRGLVMDVVLGIVALMGIYEVCSALYKGGAGKLIIASAVLSAAMLAVVYFFGKEWLAISILAGLMLIITIGILMQVDELKKYLYSIFGFIYPAVFAAHLFFIVDFEKPAMVIIALGLNMALVSMTDICAYFCGILLGRTPLCPKISPKKTVEGSLGGVVMAVGLSIGIKYIAAAFGYDIPLIHYIILGILCGLFSQCGDLIASVVKRSVGIKDYASILPGMGGIMDRIDGIIFCSPIVYYYFIFVLGL